MAKRVNPRIDVVCLRLHRFPSFECFDDQCSRLSWESRRDMILLFEQMNRFFFFWCICKRSGLGWVSDFFFSYVGKACFFRLAGLDIHCMHGVSTSIHLFFTARMSAGCWAWAMLGTKYGTDKKRWEQMRWEKLWMWRVRMMTSLCMFIKMVNMDGFMRGQERCHDGRE